MKKFFPLFENLRAYNGSKLRGDLIAGLTVGVLLIPQGMAYAMLAGLPPVYGLYAGSVPVILYALMGSSTRLSVGPAAIIALLVGSSVGPLAPVGSQEYISLVLLLSLMVGMIQLILGRFRLGFLASFISHPVISGFTTAAAIIICLSEVKNLLGVSIPRGHAWETALSLISEAPLTHLPTLSVGGLAIVVLVILRKIHKRIPSALIVMGLGIAVVEIFDLESMGVKTIGAVPSGFPGMHLPSLAWREMWQILPMAVAISLIVFIESYAMGKAVERDQKDHKVEPNQELLALGIANVVGSFFRAFPVAGGFSRTAVNVQAGAKTGVASIISAAIVILTVFFLTDYLGSLPIAALSAVIVVAAIRLIMIGEARSLWRMDRLDFWAFLVTALATLALGVEIGILVGVTCSILFIMSQISKPHVARLGRIPESSSYRNIDRFDNLEKYEEIEILRFDAQLFFANAEVFREKITEVVNSKTRFVILDAGVITYLDSTGIETLDEIVDQLTEREIQLILTEVKGPIRDKLYRTGLYEKIGKKNFFIDVHTAVETLRGNKKRRLEAYTNQFNN